MVSSALAAPIDRATAQRRHTAEQSLRPAEPAIVRACQDPRVAAQRVRLLPEVALPRRAGRTGIHTEAVTRIGDAGVPDQVCNAAAAHFDDAGIVHLLMAVAVINVWNGLAVTTCEQLPHWPGSAR